MSDRARSLTTRDLARLLRVLADVIERDELDELERALKSEAPTAAPRPSRRPERAVPHKGSRPPTEIEQARADRSLRRLGYRLP